KCLSASFKQLRHFATSGTLTNSGKKDSSDWSFLKQLEFLHLPNCASSDTPAEAILQINPGLRSFSLELNSSFPSNIFYKSLTCLDICFRNFEVRTLLLN